LSRALSDADLAVLADAVLAECDAHDGLADGIIDSPRTCEFDPSVVECAGGKTASCLTSEQVAAIEKVFGGPKSSRGEALYADWPYDAGIGSGGWRSWKLGTSTTSAPNALNVTIGFGATPYLFFTPPDPGFDPLSFDFDTDPARSAEVAPLLDADRTDLGAFRARGGKLVFYQGVSDPVFSASDLTAYYERLAAANGGVEATRDWARLFLVPGMTHCGGGTGLEDFDPLTALENWVEHGVPPERVVAVGPAFPARNRPLCAYPDQARYRGSGGTEAEASFDCR
jgi:feruloyl esterase